MTKDEIIAEMDRATAIWQEAGIYMDRLRAELTALDAPAPLSLDDMRKEMDDLVTAQAAEIAVLKEALAPEPVKEVEP